MPSLEAQSAAGLTNGTPTKDTKASAATASSPAQYTKPLDRAYVESLVTDALVEKIKSELAAAKSEDAIKQTEAAINGTATNETNGTATNATRVSMWSLNPEEEMELAAPDNTETWVSVNEPDPSLAPESVIGSDDRQLVDKKDFMTNGKYRGE